MYSRDLAARIARITGVAVFLFLVVLIPFRVSGLTQPQTQYLAGVMVLCAGILAFWGTHLTRVATEKNDLREHHREMETNLRDRFSAAATQLSDSKAGIRQAGAYALAALANDWRRHGQQTGDIKLGEAEQQVCVHILCAYLRNPVWKDDSGETEVQRTVIELLRLGTLIGESKQLSWRGLSFNLSHASLASAALNHADLSGADLSNADLSGARLTRADLSGADLSNADLSGASLIGTNLSRCILDGANLTNTDLRGAELTRATQNAETTLPSGFVLTDSAEEPPSSRPQ